MASGAITATRPQTAVLFKFKFIELKKKEKKKEILEEIRENKEVVENIYSYYISISNLRRKSSSKSRKI